MTASKSLPSHPSLESIRKDAKKLARDIAAGDSDAIGRARAHLPDARLPLSRRDAQLVLAREYGYPGWQELTAEVHQRLGNGFEWAVAEAQRVIHDNDIERLRRLLIDYPALLAWCGPENDAGLLGMAAGSFGDSFDPFREQHFTRVECAELLIDAGAVLVPSVCDGLIGSRARGLLRLFQRKGVLPRTLKFFAASGDFDAVRGCYDANDRNPAAVSEAFSCACRLEHQEIALFLLEKLITLDAEFGRRIDAGPGRSAFIRYVAEERALDFMRTTPAGLWQSFLMQQVLHESSGFVDILRSEPWMLGEACIDFQVTLVERGTLRDRAVFIAALFDLEPALLRHRPPPKSQAIEFAFTYAKTHLLPLLMRVWPIPDDLSHAAGMGDMVRVKRWFDSAGKPALGDLSNHFPANSAFARKCLQWGEPSVQQVLDNAFAWSVINSHFEVADFLLEHGADIDTTWSSHEPASILHELVFHDNYAAMQFLIDRGIDMSIADYRWGSTAIGWAFHAAKNEKMANWLSEAEQRHSQRA